MFFNFPSLSLDLLSRSEQSLSASGTACRLPDLKFLPSFICNDLFFFLVRLPSSLPALPFTQFPQVVATSSLKSAQHFKVVRCKLLRQPTGSVCLIPSVSSLELAPLLPQPRFPSVSQDKMFTFDLISVFFLHTQLWVLRKAISATWHLEEPT